MSSRAVHRAARGFTLIEVAVAVAILGWVLASALFLVSQYGDERLRMRLRSGGQQVAWNQLLEEYRRSRGWMSAQAMGSIDESGLSEERGQNWRWELQREPTQGNDLLRHTVRVHPDDSEQQAATLSAFWLRQGAL